MANSTCSVSPCETPSRRRGMCSKHYMQWRRTGDPVKPTWEQKFWRHVSKSEGCWNWTGQRDAKGYGKTSVGQELRRCLAHRASYEIANGPIPEGLVIDHMCHNPSYVNPEHLRAVTQKQNTENRKGAQRGSWTGVRGVTQEAKRPGYFFVRIRHNQKTIYVGTYTSLEEAEAAAIAKRNELFTHNDMDRKAA